jgi:hypothetical protein
VRGAQVRVEAVAVEKLVWLKDCVIVHYIIVPRVSWFHLLVVVVVAAAGAF